MAIMKEKIQGELLKAQDALDSAIDAFDGLRGDRRPNRSEQEVKSYLYDVNGLLVHLYDLIERA
jgi:hypothetical protein